MTQPDFFSKPLDARFKAFVDQNPGVVKLFTAFAVEAKMAGRTRIGAKAIAERCRWEVAITTQGDTFKINNSYVSRLARLVAQERPDLAPLFETRRLKS